MNKCIHYIDRYMQDGGGMPLFADDLAIDEMIITNETDRIDTRLKRISLDGNFVDRKDFLSIAKFENPRVIILHTLRFIDEETVKRLRENGHKVVLIVHDYYSICEKNVLINNRGQICSGPYDKNCLHCYYDKFNYSVPITRQIRNVLHPALSIVLKRSKWYEKRLEHNLNIMKNLDLVVFPTEKAKTIMMRFVDFPLKTAVINHFQKKILCRRDKPEVCEFAFIGHDSHHKGFDLIKKIVKEFKNDEIKIRLFGNFKKPIKSEHLIYEGTFENRNISAAMRKFDVLLFPSIWPETSGRVLTESAACGKYVIASNITGASEILKDYKGLLLFENNNSESLKNAMEKVFIDWKKMEYPQKPKSFMSVEEYREAIFKRLEQK